MTDVFRRRPEREIDHSLDKVAALVISGARISLIPKAAALGPSDSFRTLKKIKDQLAETMIRTGVTAVKALQVHVPTDSVQAVAPGGGNQ